MKQKSLLTILFSLMVVLALQAQQRIVKGKIIDKASNTALPNVSILEKISGKGVISDTEGNFSINVPDKAILVFSFIGYETQEIVVGNQSNIEVILSESNKLLDDVVVVGYGIQKKANLTGSVSQFKTEEITRRQVSSSSQLLQGIAPGVTVAQASGKPGADGASIRVRGVGSIFSGSDPLIMVDGVVSSMDNVDPNAIESITVLKDAASTSIYGTRGANGVILIKTIRGNKSGIKVSYNGFLTQQRATNIPEKVSAIEHMELSNVAQQTQTGNPNAVVFPVALIERYKTNPVDNIEIFDNDWVKLLLTNSGIMQNHNLTIDAGSEKASLFTSISYLTQQGLIPNNSYNRLDIRMNPDIKVNDKLRLSGTLFFNQGTRIEPAGGSPEFIIRQAIGLPATGQAKFGEGMYGSAGQSNNRNPLGQAEASGIFKEIIPRIFGKAQINYTPIKGLDFEASYAREQWTPNSKRFQKSFDIYTPNISTRSYDLSSRYPGTNSLSESYSFSFRNTFLAQASYQLTKAKHDAKIMAGFQSEEVSTRSLGASRTDFINESLPYMNLGGANRNNSGGTSENALVGAFSRLTYAFSDKYLVEINGRYEGSSRFSQALNKQWGFFPSASAGWVFSNEDFMKDLTFLQFGKIRASYGTLGNQALPDNYPFASNYTSGQDYYFNALINPGYALTEAANEGITWEKSKQTDIGLDLVLIKGLSITADYYIKQISDILLRKPIPNYVGLSPAFLNLGTMENRGWEFSTTYKNKIGKLKYDVTGVLADVKNKITSLPGTPYLDEGLLRSTEGYSLRSYYGYEAIGYYQSKEDIASSPKTFFTPNPGDIKYADTNGDGVVNADDRTFIGNNFPRYEYSINLNLVYDIFDLNLFGQGVGKKANYISGTGAWPFFAADFVPSLLAMHKDYWTPENPNATFPRLTPTIGVNSTNSSFWVKNSAYFRLKNVNLGMKVPQPLVKKLGIESARIYVSGQNLLTFTKFWKGFDPEQNNNNAEFYPLMKTYTVGLNLKF
ncbi:TonB-dependent receptor [Emticicia sp. W12TSBA100-4]|uniref:SusC/RagA family TonB-linked outer membrane protein n=1 Tax=Emticicia sp. W12TSBA100-4 TaxID=3160965 RepID=UPI00330679B0